MEIKIKKPIRGTVLEIVVDDKDDKEAISKALFFAQPDYCGLCKKTNIIWSSNKAKSKKDGAMFTYLKRICLDCKAQSTAGEYKDGGFFWKQWELWEPKQSTDEKIDEPPADFAYDDE